MRQFLEIVTFLISQLSIVVGAFIVMLAPLAYLVYNKIIVKPIILAPIAIALVILVGVSIQYQVMDKLQGE